MAIEINYNKTFFSKLTSNLVFFSDEKLNLNDIKKTITKEELTYIHDLTKKHDLKKKIFVFEINSKKTIVIVKIKKNTKESEIESLGAEFYRKVCHGKKINYYIISDSIEKQYKNFLIHFLH